MRRTQWLQEHRLMKFEQANDSWQQNRLTQKDAASLLNVCARTFRRYIDRYEENGIQGLIDKRLGQVSWHRALVHDFSLSSRYLYLLMKYCPIIWYTVIRPLHTETLSGLPFGDGQHTGAHIVSSQSCDLNMSFVGFSQSMVFKLNQIRLNKLMGISICSSFTKNSHPIN